ncbi:MAG: hypothetical protein GY757_61780 [bacterium]|nr:hypothetical protein [bacterium]
MITALAQFLLNVNPVINGRKAKEILRNSNPDLINKNINAVMTSINQGEKP